MTILFHGTTLSELTDGALNAATRETTASLIGPYVSGGVKMFGDDLGSEFTFTDDGDIWATIYHATDSDAGDFEFFELRDDSTSLLRMQHTGSSQRLQYWNGSVWTTVATFAVSSGVAYRYDIHCKIADSGGEFSVYLDGVQKGIFSGDTLLTASTTVNTIVLAPATDDAAEYSTFSAVVVEDADTRDLLYAQLDPTGAGTNSDFTGAYTDVDEAGIDDTDFISSTTDADVSTFACTNIPVALQSGHDVVAVGVTARGSRGASGVANIRPAVYSNATLGEGASQALDLAMSPYRAVFAVDPDTTSAWSVSAVNAAEIGCKASAS